MLISYVKLLWKSACWHTSHTWVICLFSQMSGYPTTVTCFSFGFVCLHSHWRSLTHVLYVCHMFILFLNLLTYESHIKSYVLQNMFYMSYVLYVLSYVLYVYHNVSQKTGIFWKIFEFSNCTYVICFCHMSYLFYMFFICYSYVCDMSLA